jgi:hypothetical protein
MAAIDGFGGDTRNPSLPEQDGLYDLPLVDPASLPEGGFFSTKLLSLTGLKTEEDQQRPKARLTVEDRASDGAPRATVSWELTGTDMSYNNGGICANEALFTLREGEEIAVWVEFDGRNGWFGAAVAEKAKAAIEGDWSESDALWVRCDESHQVFGPGASTEMHGPIPKQSEVVVRLSYASGDGTLGTLSIAAEGDAKPFVLCDSLPVGCVPLFGLWGTDTTLTVKEIRFSRAGTYVKAARPR